MQRSRTSMLLGGTVLIALGILLHVALGWQWTIAAGIGAGAWIGGRGWLLGMIVVAADWGLLVAYNYYVDARAVGAMTEAVGGILGNMPSFAVVAITLFLGALIGLLGGALGTQLRKLMGERSRKPVAV